MPKKHDPDASKKSRAARAPRMPPPLGTDLVAKLQAAVEAARRRHEDAGRNVSPWSVREDDLSGAATRDLLRLHLEGMHAHSPPGSVFALDHSGLTSAGVTVWTVWRGDRIAGMGALKELGGGAGELKSMRTHPDFLRQGVAAGLLDHIIAAARTRGMTRLSLETGSGAPFEPALALYRRRGFVAGGPFADYVPGPFNRFLHLDL